MDRMPTLPSILLIAALTLGMTQAHAIPVHVGKETSWAWIHAPEGFEGFGLGLELSDQTPPWTSDQMPPQGKTPPGNSPGPQGGGNSGNSGNTGSGGNNNSGNSGNNNNGAGGSAGGTNGGGPAEPAPKLDPPYYPPIISELPPIPPATNWPPSQDTNDEQATQLPEPGSLALFVLGISLLAVWCQRSRSKDMRVRTRSSAHDGLFRNDTQQSSSAARNARAIARRDHA